MDYRKVTKKQRLHLAPRRAATTVRKQHLDSKNFPAAPSQYCGLPINDGSVTDHPIPRWWKLLRVAPWHQATRDRRRRRVLAQLLPERLQENRTTGSSATIEET